MTSIENRQKQEALSAIGGRKEKTSSDKKAFRVFLGALTLVTALAVADQVASHADRGQSAAPTADTGKNLFPLTAPGLHETLMAPANSKDKGQLVKVSWGPNNLSTFTEKLIDSTPGAGKYTTEKDVAGTDQGELATNTVGSGGTGIEAGSSNDMKLSVDTNITELNRVEKPYDTKIVKIK